MGEKIIGAKQQGEAETSDNRASKRARLRRIQAPASALHSQASGEGKQNLRGTNAEIAKVGTGGQQDPQREDLEKTWIA